MMVFVEYTLMAKNGIDVPICGLKKTDYSFSEYYFNDLNPLNISSLKSWSKEEIPNKYNGMIKYYSEDYKSAVKKIMNYIDNNKLYFAFVDPTNIDFDFECIKLLSNNHRIDLMILFALGMSMQRNIDKWLESNDVTKIDIFLGGQDWRDEFRRHFNSTTRWKTLYDYYCKNIMKLGYLEPDSVYDTFGIKNSRNRNIYYLTFFSKNKRGYDFFRNIKKYASLQTSLL
ncbi:MAG: three-Cys-motif partner protein TcmP [Desulfobacterales bacterium]